MAGGEVEAVFKGLAEDAEQAGKNIAESVAKATEKAADIEDENLAESLGTDAKAAENITKAGEKDPPATPTPKPESGGGGEQPPEEPPKPTGPPGGEHTGPSGEPDPNATPGGRKTKIDPKNDADTKRSLQRENESADILAKNGYDVEQNPSVPGNKNPDYKIEGQIFDNYAPKTGNARNIASWIQTKVDEGQADRIVLNLTDSPVDPAKLSAQLHDWPISGLKEIKVIDKSGNVIDFYP